MAGSSRKPGAGRSEGMPAGWTYPPRTSSSPSGSVRSPASSRSRPGTGGACRARTRDSTVWSPRSRSHGLTTPQTCSERCSASRGRTGISTCSRPIPSPASSAGSSRRRGAAGGVSSAAPIPRCWVGLTQRRQHEPLIFSREPIRHRIRMRIGRVDGGAPAPHRGHRAIGSLEDPLAHRPRMQDPEEVSPEMVPRLDTWRWKAALALGSTVLALLLAALAGEAAVRYRESHRHTVPGTMPLLFYRHVRLGYALVRDYNYFGWVHVNRQGFRGSDVAMDKPPGTTRIIAVGGSTTFDTFVSR